MLQMFVYMSQVEGVSPTPCTSRTTAYSLQKFDNGTCFHGYTILQPRRLHNKKASAVKKLPVTSGSSQRIT